MTKPLKLVNQKVFEGKRARRCGECAACCTTLGVPELDPPKPAGQTCPNCRTNGSNCCRIETTKPKICRSYKCLWLQGLLPREGRPDRLGLIFDQPGPGVFSAVAAHLKHPPLVAREVFSGAADLPGARDALRSLSAVFLIVVVEQPNASGQLPNRRLLYGPTVEAVKALEQEMLRLRAAVTSVQREAGGTE